MTWTTILERQFVTAEAILGRASPSICGMRFDILSRFRTTDGFL